MNTIPPAVQGTIEALEQKGYVVRVRQQRSGSLRYTIGAGRDMTALQLFRFYERTHKVDRETATRRLTNRYVEQCGRWPNMRQDISLELYISRNIKQVMSGKAPLESYEVAKPLSEDELRRYRASL